MFFYDKVNYYYVILQVTRHKTLGEIRDIYNKKNNLFYRQKSYYIKSKNK